LVYYKLFFQNLNMGTRVGEEFDGVSTVRKNTKWIRLGDKQYNVTHFKHPGGSVMNYMDVSHANGSDAQHVFKQFHLRSVRAVRVLKALPSKPYVFNTSVDEDDAMLQDYVEFTNLLIEEGFFKGNWT